MYFLISLAILVVMFTMISFSFKAMTEHIVTSEVDYTTQIYGKTKDGVKASLLNLFTVVIFIPWSLANVYFLEASIIVSLLCSISVTASSIVFQYSLTSPTLYETRRKIFTWMSRLSLIVAFVWIVLGIFI